MVEVVPWIGVLCVYILNFGTFHLRPRNQDWFCASSISSGTLIDKHHLESVVHHLCRGVGEGGVGGAVAPPPPPPPTLCTRQGKKISLEFTRISIKSSFSHNVSRGECPWTPPILTYPPLLNLLLPLCCGYCNGMCSDIALYSIIKHSTVEPLYNGHYWGKPVCPL